MTPERTGYLSQAYLDSFSGFGEVNRLPGSGAALIVRPIPATPLRDAMGLYPLTVCDDWASLPADLASLGRELVSVVMVADPFADAALVRRVEKLEGASVTSYKTHRVVALGEDLDAQISRHHRYYARRSCRKMSVERLENAPDHLDEWCGLYESLVRRHGISGLQAFSRPAFSAQLRVPGLLAFRARVGTETLGWHLWITQGTRAYHHLSAFSERGYRERASYALMYCALEQLRVAGVEWADLGASAGEPGAAGDGLSTFKDGWARMSREALLVRVVLRESKYRELCREWGDDAEYFPAYRVGELTGRAFG